MNRLVVTPLHHFHSNYKNPFPRKVSLGNGYFIKQFNPNILNPVFDFFNEGFTERDRQDLRNCSRAIYYSYQVDDGSSGTPPEVVNEINRIIQTLRIVKRTRTIPTIIHLNIRGRKKTALQVIHKPLVNITFPTTQPSEQFFSKSDAHKVRLYVGQVRNLYQRYQGTYHKVLNAIIFFEVGHQNHLYKPRIVHFVTCLESLFNTSDQQISYSLRLRCSYFLERNGVNRAALSRLVKNIYSLRSKFVHGQATPGRILSNPEEQTRLLTSAEDIARRCIQKIFDRDLVAIFDNTNTLNQAFEDLELGLPSQLR